MKNSRERRFFSSNFSLYSLIEIFCNINKEALVKGCQFEIQIETRQHIFPHIVEGEKNVILKIRGDMIGYSPVSFIRSRDMNIDVESTSDNFRTSTVFDWHLSTF